MKVLAIASRKGGSGKTTLAGHLAVEAERRDRGPVALVDTDPQGSLADWWNARQSDTPVFAKTDSLTLKDRLSDLAAANIGLVVVDTPPSLDESVRAVIACADLVLIPTRPSPHDLRSIGATVDIAEELGKPLVFVLNSATVNARLTTEAVKVLSRHGPLAPAIIHHRVDFAASMTDGRTALELPGSHRSAEEISALWSYIDTRLGTAERAPILPRFAVSSTPTASALAG